MGKSWAEKGEGIKKERKEIKRIVLKEGGRKEKLLNINRLLSIEIPPEVKFFKNYFSTNSNKD